jgi:hypothetical protein
MSKIQQFCSCYGSLVTLISWQKLIGKKEIANHPMSQYRPVKIFLSLKNQRYPMLVNFLLPPFNKQIY